MTRKDLAREISSRTGIPQNTTYELLGETFDAIGEILAQGDKITIRGFGEFGVTMRAGRNFWDLTTGKKYYRPKRRVPFFKPSDQFTEKININRK